MREQHLEPRTLYNRYEALGLEGEIRGLAGAMGYDVASSDRFRQCWNEWKRLGAGQRFGGFVDLVEAR